LASAEARDSFNGSNIALIVGVNPGEGSKFQVQRREFFSPSARPRPAPADLRCAPIPALIGPPPCAMPVAYKDYYAILGVPRTASDDEIKRAFRRQARAHHPDVAADKAAAEERFKEIREAYEVLSNPEHRRRFDRLGPHWKPDSEFRPPQGWRRRPGARSDDGRADGAEARFGPSGFSEFFETLFGARRAARHHDFGTRASEASNARGDDIESEILVALDEALHGSVRTVNVRRGDPDSAPRASFQVRIPPGVREGQLIRVAGKGQPGPAGNPGDLLLRVRFAPHPDFTARDRDLWTELSIAPWEAVLGATVTLRSLDGPIALRVPPGSRRGQQLRARGRGLPGGDGTRGDLYAVLQIETPTNITDEERALWQRLSEISSFRPGGVRRANG
jgi:curved DNA-binding protein